MIYSDAAELPTAGCGGFWTRNNKQVQERQIHQNTEAILGSSSD